MGKHLLLYEDSNTFDNEQATESEKNKLICYGNSSTVKTTEMEETTRFSLKLDPVTKFPLSGKPVTVTASVHDSAGDYVHTTNYPVDSVGAFTGECAMPGKWYFIPWEGEGSVYCFNAELVSSGVTAITEEGATTQITYGEFRGILSGQSSPTSFFGCLGVKEKGFYASLNDGTSEPMNYYASLSDLIDAYSTASTATPLLLQILSYHIPNKLGGAKYVTSVVPGVAYVTETKETFYNSTFSITVKYFEYVSSSLPVHYISSRTVTDTNELLSDLLGDWKNQRTIDIIDGDPLVEGGEINLRDLNYGVYGYYSEDGKDIDQHTLTYYDLNYERFNERANGKVITIYHPPQTA